MTGFWSQIKGVPWEATAVSEHRRCESWHLYGFCFLLGDGGNDVSMIQEADCGVGVEGKVRLLPTEPLSQLAFPVKTPLRVHILWSRVPGK